MSKRTAAAKAPGNAFDRANGFLLGCFLTLIRYRFARSKFALHRNRVGEFLAEVDAPIELPTSRASYDRDADEILQRAITECRQRSVELGDFALLGVISSVDSAMRLWGAVESDALRHEAGDILERYQLARHLYDRFLAGVRDETKDIHDPDDVHIDMFLTPAMELLCGAIEPLPPNPSACFVAMPFKRPYARYFSLFYRPLAGELDCSAFRMWGGLSGEAYVDLMLMIMRRCRVVIADLSELNPNVLYEFGVARGLDKMVVPLCQRRFVDQLPANIASDQLLQLYSPRERDWPAVTVLRCAAQVALKEFALEIAEKRIAEARWVPGQQLPQLATEDA